MPRNPLTRWQAHETIQLVAPPGQGQEGEIMTTIDVNAQFASEKIAQLEGQRNRVENANARREVRLADLRKRAENGEMSERSNANGSITFTVTAEGWDRGETWTVQPAQVKNPNEIIMPNHGLDVNENGDVALYLNGTNGPAWHALGNVIPGGLSDTVSVLKAGGLYWDVFKEEMTRNGKIVKGKHFIVREDTDDVLGVVGDIYTAVQNADAYEMLSELIGLGMVCESAGTMNGGSKVFVTAEIPEPVVIDPNGIADQVRQFLAIMNSHDGKGQVMGVVTPWRVLCGNTHRFAIRDAVASFKIRHTKNAMNKMAQAREALGHTVEYFAHFAAEETSLVQATFSHDELDALIKDVWELKPGKDGQPSKRAVTISTNRTEKIHELFDAESNRVGRNAFAAENAITGYVDHFAELRPRGDLKGNRLAALGDAIMSETNDEPKSKAHSRLMLKVRGA
jgi:phage/plasmid-like protein (TIGR03299 family)